MVAFDVERARADTPGCDLGVHLNNAGASLPVGIVGSAVAAAVAIVSIVEVSKVMGSP